MRQAPRKEPSRRRLRHPRRRLGSVLPLLLLPLLAACDGLPFGPGDDGGPDPVPTITELPRALTPVELAVIEGSEGFGLDLLRAVAAEEGAGENIVLSPLSASMALGMTLEGAEGTTFEQMRDVLGFEGLDREELSRAYRDLVELLYDLDPTVDFRIANSVWHRTGFDPEEDFLEAVRKHFDAEVEGLDFSSSDAARIINDWVERKTEGRIDEIVEDPIDALTVMFLINALYFHGTWTYEFEPDETRPAPFTLRDGTTVEVPMMVRDVGATLVSTSADHLALELPYGGEAWAMTVVVPRDQDLHDFAASLDVDRWTAILADFEEQNAVVELPRFRLEYEKTLGHTNDPDHRALQSLGMEHAFVPGMADFTRLHRYALQDGLHIHEVKQKTWIDVNEEGTEAAAVTSVEIQRVSGPATVRVDRPFLFAIRERLSGTLLFVGLVEDPRGE